MSELMWVPVDELKFALGWIATADHLGDVNNALPTLVEALGFERPTWDDELNRWVMPWEEDV